MAGRLEDARDTTAVAYHGGLTGRSLGEMLSAGNPSLLQAAYVAIESFEGALDGKRGSFALAHLGEMDAEGEELRICIVPGSGAGELTGLRGNLQIRREGAKHHYTLTYSISQGNKKEKS
ncbi:DUF3224 domain-containing protein [Paraburkholderia tropica]|uniref:DUF3224 domain-containing protein n=1 Tax=Paraburkholderia tropica TaxID=92647 RepID=UPI001591F39B|nr:DUF3224 domain-containing protein [Paraburkholderia tropica]